MARFKRNMCKEIAQAKAHNDIFLKGCVLYLLVKEELRKGMDKDDLICAQTTRRNAVYSLHVWESKDLLDKNLAFCVHLNSQSQYSRGKEMKKQKTRRVGAMLLAMMMLFTMLPVTALAEVPETEGPGAEESVNAVPNEQAVEHMDDGESTQENAMPEEEATMSGANRAPAPTTTKDLTVEVTLDTTMKMIMNRDQSYTFRVNGEEYKIPVTSSTGSGPITFTATFPEVPFPDGQTEADVKLERLPEDIEDYHTVVQQEYNSNTKKLHVTLGRNLYIRVFHLGDGVTYFDFATKNNFTRAQMTLFDEQGHEVLRSKLGYHDYFGQMPVLFGVRPGTYKVKITQIPGGETYDIDRMYTLRVQDNGASTLEIYQQDGAYHLANIHGAKSAGDPMLDGYKTPLAICVTKKSKAKKEIVGGYEQGKKRMWQRTILSNTRSRRRSTAITIRSWSLGSTSISERKSIRALRMY